MPVNCRRPSRLLACLAGAAHYPVFFRRKFLFPVDLPSTRHGERTLGFVSIRPARYINNPAIKMLFSLQQEFHRKLTRTNADQWNLQAV